MKLFATAAALAALVGTAALADNNELFVTQSGNNNVIGNADQPATQIGTQNDATFVQSGNDNSIGDVGPNVANMSAPLEPAELQKVLASVHANTFSYSVCDCTWSAELWSCSALYGYEQ